MKTSVIDIDHINSNEEVVAYFEHENLQQGDTLKLVTKEKRNKWVLTAVVIVVVIALIGVELKRRREENGAAMLNDLFKGKSLEDIEAQIRSEYGINLEVETNVDTEREDWQRFAMSNFARAYENDEADYFDANVAEPNPDYKSWKAE